MLLRTAARNVLSRAARTGPTRGGGGGGGFVRRRAVSGTAAARAVKKDTVSGADAGPPKLDSTVFFRMTNPELFLDIKSARTWYLVGFVWVAFGGSYAYLRYGEYQEEEQEAAEKARREAEHNAVFGGPAPNGIGPAPRPRLQ
jgi:hypothetical protein